MLHDDKIPSNHDAMAQLAQFIGHRIVVAHNASFDWRFLSAEFAAEGCPLPERPPVCTLILSKRLLPKQSSYRLAHLADLIDFIPPPNCSYHRAMTDVYATVKLWLHLQDLAQQSREELIELGEIKPPKRQQHKDEEKTTKAESTVPCPSDSKVDAISGQRAKGGGEQGSSIVSTEEEKVRALAYKNIHFPSKQNVPPLPEPSSRGYNPFKEICTTSSIGQIYFFHDGPPIIPVFPPGDLVINKNMVHKTTQPWRDSYELFQFTDKSFEQVVSEHPRKLARSTIFNHILDALRQGEAVNLMRLVEGTRNTYPTPTPEECRLYQRVLSMRNIDPTTNGSWYLKPVFDIVKDAEIDDSKTYSKLKWYQLIMFHGLISKHSGI
jgi:hypothetical protein